MGEKRFSTVYLTLKLVQDIFPELWEKLETRASLLCAETAEFILQKIKVEHAGTKVALFPPGKILHKIEDDVPPRFAEDRYNGGGFKQVGTAA
ncbi:hypothetical protein QQF64_018698 [Cirrhinus molitorella]|uniref:Uncharacterized protein n=1 Tax=Cirrhinus molitorella TaxID=172907 RepID=A0ABR3LGW5_9TELE